MIAQSDLRCGPDTGEKKKTKITANSVNSKRLKPSCRATSDIRLSHFSALSICPARAHASSMLPKVTSLGCCEPQIVHQKAPTKNEKTKMLKEEALRPYLPKDGLDILAALFGPVALTQLMHPIFHRVDPNISVRLQHAWTKCSCPAEAACTILNWGYNQPSGTLTGSSRGAVEANDVWLQQFVGHFILGANRKPVPFIATICTYIYYA